MITDRIPYRAFDDKVEYLRDLYSIYEEAYDIPEIVSSFELNDVHSFEYCQDREYFVVVVPYTYSKELLVERTFTNSKLGWILTGGSLRTDLNETFIACCRRLVSKHIENAELGELEPLALITNIFKYGDRECKHKGIAFTGRIRNLEPHKIIKKTINSRGKLIPYHEPTTLSQLNHNDKVLEIAKEYLKKHNIDKVPEAEILENLKYKKRYVFHNKITKPLFRISGRFLFPHSILYLENKIKEILFKENPKTIIDVACGENVSVLEYAKNKQIEIVVGNDVSWSQLEFLSRKISKDGIRGTQSFLLFTNHDARKLPFKDKYFDALICKNVLHHMEDLDSLRMLMQEMIRISKTVLIVEILDPKFESLWGKIRHKYYLKFLHDAGENFLSRKEFDAVTANTNRIDKFELKTIRGIYQFAIIKESDTI